MEVKIAEVDPAEIYDTILKDDNYEYARHALRFVKDELFKYGVRSIALSCNGGKDCIVVLHLLRAVLAHQARCGKEAEDAIRNLDVVYFRVPNEFPEAEAFMRELERRYGFRIVTLELPIKPALERFLAETGTKAILMGQRQGDPDAAGDEEAETDRGWPSFIRLNPILRWRYDHVWHFLRSFGLPYCKLYDQGYTSLGATTNTVRNPALCLPSGEYLPAWRLTDGAKERQGRVKSGLGTPTNASSPSSSASSSSASSSSSSSSAGGGTAFFSPRPAL